MASLQTRDRRARRRLAKNTGSLVGKRVIVSTRLLLDALFDPQIGRGTAELLALSHGTAMGTTKGKRECFVCCRAWAPTLAPIGVMVTKVVGTEQGLLSLICLHCFTGKADAALLAALQRDFGLTSPR
jgi:hypothetical protein